MTAKILSKDLYKILREVLAPLLKGAGFKRSTAGMLGWYRPVNDQYLTLWFQCDRYGWLEDFGSSFTLEFQMSGTPEPGSGSILNRRRFATLLSVDDREVLRHLNNEILTSLPSPGPSSIIHLLPESSKEAFLESYRPRGTPYHVGALDVWMHYFSTRDVELWAAFLHPKLLDLVNGFLADPYL